MQDAIAVKDMYRQTVQIFLYTITKKDDDFVIKTRDIICFGVFRDVLKLY